MTREEIIATIRKNAEAIRAEGVTKLAIFGSRARGDNRADSDIDVLIEVEPDISFSILDLIGVEHIIQDATGLHSGRYGTSCAGHHAPVHAAAVCPANR
jgi:uncharacterized protein